MSIRVFVKPLHDPIPGSRLFQVIAYLRTAVSDETSNAGSLKAMAELDSGGGDRFSGSIRESAVFCFLYVQLTPVEQCARLLFYLCCDKIAGVERNNNNQLYGTIRKERTKWIDAQTRTHITRQDTTVRNP